MGALNLPSAADVERLTRRLRSVSQRLEGIEDGVHRIGRTLSGPSIETRLAAIEEQLRALSGKLDDRSRETRASGANPRFGQRPTAKPAAATSRTASKSTAATKRTAINGRPQPNGRSIRRPSKTLRQNAPNQRADRARRGPTPAR